MIKNNKQLEIRQEHLAGFRNALSTLLTSEKNSPKDPILKKAQIDALRSSIEEFEREIKTYESLREGELCAVMGGQFFEIARILIQTRIAKDWSQTDLAQEIGIEPQQIQRYEATDYEGAGLTRIYDVIDALDVSLRIFMVHHIEEKNRIFESNAANDAVQNIFIGRRELFKITA